MDSLDKFRAVADKPYEWLKAWKSANPKKIVGCAPMHFPEELVHAAGFLPVVLQESDEPITLGNAHFFSFNCGLTRSVIDLLVKGKLEVLDGLAIPDTCTEMRSTCATMFSKSSFPYFEYSQPPVRLSNPNPLPRVIEEYRRLKASLEKFSGQEISNTALKKSITVYNWDRALVRKLYDLRRKRPGLLPAKDICAVAVAGMVMPREDHSKLMVKLLAALENKKNSPDKKVKVFLSGQFCQPPKSSLLDLIEDVGAMVVDDEVYAGFKYYANDVTANGDPVEALANRYVNMFPPCPTRSDLEHDPAEYVVKAVRKAGAQGVIALQPKTCEPHIMYYPHLKVVLEKAGIPQLFIETEHDPGSLAAVRTRLQAFVEMIKSR